MSDEVTAIEIRKKLTEVLTHSSIDLATSEDGVNWATSAFFANLDEDLFRLTLILENRGRTLGQLKANPNVGVKVVPGGIADPFAQGLGTVTLRDDSERDETFQALLRKEPQVEPFFASPVTAVVIDIDWWRVTHLGGGWLPGKVLERGNGA
ncbi:pyridoxamine 5'-phosphate oxidase family protein [Nocardia speluncae]|uniref:Pyridoxamine 5'-phosphate oxidase family protein n=1 Tax=Nocardia speluncae TaxID=419477 RepID=A0A846X7A3_9NOCA|nr:hypothetical protein [Nocardia speluncae]NKY32061.1 pyridoxamine 5'-phosphate oxidase family protein [Nocardia speluncae]